MIPKILHFVWIGDESKIPPYGIFAIDAFRRLNPGFEVRFHKNSFEQMLDAVARDRRSFMKDIVNLTFLFFRNTHEEYSRRISDFGRYAGAKYDEVFYYAYVNFNCILSNMFRKYAVNRYGGIYCDLDCYPVKPFDDRLLGRKAFYIDNGNMHDIFFFGKERASDQNALFRDIYPVVEADPRQRKDENDILFQNLFNPNRLKNRFYLDNPNLDFRKVLKSRFEKCLLERDTAGIDELVSQYRLKDYAYLIHSYVGEKYNNTK